MTFKRPYGAGLAALAVGLFAATAAYAEPTVNKGDNAWMLTSTVLVLLMTIPGLALFYGGLVRTGPSGDRTHENRYGDYQAIQTRRSPGCPDRHWRSRSHGD